MQSSIIQVQNLYPNNNNIFFNKREDKKNKLKINNACDLVQLEELVHNILILPQVLPQTCCKF